MTWQPYRPRNPSPWPRRIAYTLLIAAAALLLYAFSAEAAQPRPTDKPWPPKTPDYSYVCKHRPEIVSAWRCAKFNSRQPRVGR